MCLTVVSAALIALWTVNRAYFCVLRMAIEKKVVDCPDARKDQKVPIPVMGGIAVFFGVVAGILGGSMVQTMMGYAWSQHLLPIFCVMSIMVRVGTFDDVLGLSPRSRFVIEVLILLGLIYATNTCIDSFHGLWGVESYSWWFGVPLTLFAGVGIINAVNMVDGVNGLASGLCMLSCGLFGGIFLIVGDLSNAILAFSMVFALLPFFIHNVFGNRSRMFLGDAGTMMMGAVITWFVICLLGSENEMASFVDLHEINVIALLLAVMSVPVFDALQVMGLRMRRGCSPFKPDKNHLHHVFLRVGISHFITTMSEIAMNVCIVGGWLLSVHWGASLDVQLYVVISLSVLLVWGTHVFLHYQAKFDTPFLRWLVAFSDRTHLGRTVWWRNLSDRLDAPCQKWAC